MERTADDWWNSPAGGRLPGCCAGPGLLQEELMMKKAGLAPSRTEDSIRRLPPITARDRPHVSPKPSQQCSKRAAVPELSEVLPASVPLKQWPHSSREAAACYSE
jgi:hypothetical protein